MEARDAARSRAAADEAKRRSIEVVNVGDHHMSRMYSTDHDKTPNHGLCPKGPTSWCKYNRVLAVNELPGRHTPTFGSDSGKIIFPVTKRSTDSDLLKRCAKMTIQNTNESFNSKIWQHCLKTQFVYVPAVEQLLPLPLCPPI
ncbi:hypothetical protein RRG08_018810 [Elysia crispata]|uniref:Uncharacterized protein n=1 Tax=Elysia crispata TaxID=231223 RepID=A0AAE0ZSJ1_9GAST|nr:hypothetical protein RRG08_018810 [Elysia crispata]